MGCYSDKCQFAHGLAELSSLSHYPKYKPEPCHTLHTNGFCTYGTCCHFIHNPKEERGPRPRLRQNASLDSASSGPALDWAALRAAFSPDLELELVQTLGLGLGKGRGGGCCCRQHHQQHQQLQRASGLPMVGRSLFADSLFEQDNSSNSGSESPIFEQGRWLPIFSRISVSD